LVGLTAVCLIASSKLGGQMETSTGPVALKLSLAGNMTAAANNMRSNQRGTVLYALQRDQKHEGATRQDYAKKQRLNDRDDPEHAAPRLRRRRWSFA
jgi:hypothetical protein